MMFGGDNHKSVVIPLGGTVLTDGSDQIHLFRAPKDLEIERFSLGVGEDYRAEGGTAIWALENWGTGGSAAKATGGSIMPPSSLSGSVWSDFQVHTATVFTEASVSEGEWIVLNYSPQATNAGSAINPVAQLDFVFGGGYS